jgi:hypothetical protein
MWGTLLAASMAGWLHQLTATPRGEAILSRGLGCHGDQRSDVTPDRMISSGCPQTARSPPGTPVRRVRDGHLKIM